MLRVRLLLFVVDVDVEDVDLSVWIGLLSGCALLLLPDSFSLKTGNVQPS